MNSNFQRIKEIITMEQIADRYGFEVKRGMMVCPFHNEKTPSLKVYPGSRGWYCFGCNEGGSVIDFESKLSGLCALDAAKKICNDFHLTIMDSKPDPVAMNRRRIEKECREAEKRYMEERFSHNIKVYKRIWGALREAPPGPIAAKYMAQIEYMDYWFEEDAKRRQRGRRCIETK